MSPNLRSFDVVIVGNGAIGLACAFALADQRPDLSVCVVGTKARPGGASVAAGAMLGCHGEITSYGLSTPSGQAKFALARNAKALWVEWVVRLGERGPVPKLIDGTFVLMNALSGDIEDDNFSAMLQQLVVDGVPHQHVERHEIPGLRPTMDARPFQAIYIPDENAIDAILYIKAIEEIISQMPGVTLIDDRVVSLQLENDSSVVGVRIGSGDEISTRRVLLAAGIGCQTLIDQCRPLAKRIPRIFAGVGSSLVVGQPPERINHVLRTPNRSFACGLHVVPRNEQVYIGATNTVREREELIPRIVDIQFLLDCVIPQISEPLHESPLLSATTGCRPVSSDGFPLIGKTSIEGLFIATGTYRDGILLSPLLAQDMAAQLIGKDGLIGDTFLPERSPLWTLTIDEAVKLCARHYLSVFYENGCHLPKVGWEKFLLELLEREVRDVFDACGAEYLPPIDFIHMLRERGKSRAAESLANYS